jgi:hypothetical protein
MALINMVNLTSLTLFKAMKSGINDSWLEMKNNSQDENEEGRQNNGGIGMIQII